MPRKRGLRTRIATFATILFFLAAMVTGGFIYQRQQQLENKLLENLVWASYQFDRAVREFHLVLVDETLFSLQELELQFELLFSRMQLFTRGDIGRATDQSLELSQIFEDVRGIIEGLDQEVGAIVSGERKLTPEYREHLLEEIDDIQSLTSRLLVDTNAGVASMRASERQDLLRLYGVVLALITLLMMAGSVLVTSLIRAGQRHEAKSRQLEKQARLLDETANRAEEASRAKSEFMAVMSHEIRTPLNGVVGVTDLLGDEPMSAQGQQLLDSLGDSVLGLQAVINDVIDYTKYESGVLDLDLQPFEVNAFITQLSRSYQLQSEKRDITFNVIIEDEVPPWLQGDTNRLRQLLMNLLNNAFKFTSEGAISLKVQQTEEGNVRFLVRDTGCGIPEERRQALFKPFSQVDSSISRRYGGSGLGLAICKRLVTAMKGSIDFESRVGLGSLFWFDLPLESLSREEASQLTGTPLALTGRTAPSLPHGRILVVEDHPTNRELAQAMLERLGQTVSVAENGQSALEQLARESFDLVLMDMQMPVLDGLQTTRRWRQQETSNAPRLPIVAMTANAMPADKQRCREAGMDDVLCKPFTREDLYRTLRQVLTHADGEVDGPSPGQPTSFSGAPPTSVVDSTAAGPKSHAASPLLDADTLAALEASLGHDTLCGLVERFIERLDERHTRMVQALDHGDRHDLAEAAHALKGAAVSMGCTGLAGVAAELECQAPELDIPRLQDLVEHLSGLRSSTRAALVQRGYLDSPQPCSTSPTSSSR